MNTAPLPVGAKLPLLFTYRDTLFGNGFIVEVQATNGRILGAQEDDGFWMYGINPGGIAAHGADGVGAHAAFRRTFSNVLVDLAHEAQSFSEFKTLVESFFAETNEGYVSEWDAAVQAVRSHQVVAPGLPSVPADSPRTITVESKHAVRAEDNRADFEPLLAA